MIIHFFEKIKGVPIKKVLFFLIRKGLRLKQRIPKRLFDKKDSINEALSSYSSSMKYFIEYEEFFERVKSSDMAEKIVENANLILNNKLPILTKDAIELGEDIRWNYDYVKGVEISALKDAKANGSDIKRIWELSRLHQLTPLFKAYIISQDSTYINKIKVIVIDWIDKNPCYKGPNWINPMEISIRCANIINALFLCPGLKEDTLWMKRVNKLLFWSGVFIRYHLENTTLVNNNHYFSDLVGLIFLSIYFNSTDHPIVKKETKNWLDYAFKEINNESRVQILRDGGSMEKSTSYHAYVLELLFVSCLLLKDNTNKDLSTIKETINKMRGFILRFSHNNLIPFIGDSDNTRLFQFSDDYPFINQHDYCFLVSKLETHFGKEIEHKSCFRDSGHYFITDGTLDVVINCGHLYANAGHCHNDQLAYILWYENEQITEDPGSFCYTSDKCLRDYFRGTALHSTIMIDEQEQNTLTKCFEIKEKTKSQCLLYSQTSFSGLHKGYYSDYGVILKRKVRIERQQLVVTDDAGIESNCISRIVLSTNVKHIGGNLFKTDKCQFKIESDNSSFNLIEGAVSPAYGQCEKTIIIEMRFHKQLNYKITFGS